jgi:transposase
MPGRRKRSWSAALTAKVALAAIEEVETITQLASKHGVHPTQFHQWKKSALGQNGFLFVPDW